MKKILLLIFILQSFLLSGAFTSNLSGKCVSGEQVFVYNKTYICKPPQKPNYKKQNNSDKINQESSCERVNSQTSKLSRY